MAAHARSESARRVSDCVTALLRDQPFFGSLALRLPIRADATRETLASDGKDIRYAPQWVADTDADRIKTALARVVLACALKHHTRRGGRDPERWQRASQLVTHGLLRDAGFVLPPRPRPGTASAPSRPTTGSRNRPTMQRIRAMCLHPAMWMTVAALPAPKRRRRRRSERPVRSNR